MAKAKFVVKKSAKKAPEKEVEKDVGEEFKVGFEKALQSANDYTSLFGKKILEFDVKKTGITQSLITKKRTCERSARFSMMGIYKKEKQGYALVYGIVFHEFLDLMYSMVSKGEVDSMDELLGLMGDIEHAIMLRFADKMPGSGDPAEENYALAMAVASKSVVEYFKFWSRDFFGAEKKKWLSMEQEFAMKFDNLTMRGKRDGDFEDAQGGLWLLETKTKGKFSEQDLAMTIERDLQVNVYLKSMEQDYGRAPLGCLYNVIRRPQLRQGKAEDLNDFAVRCVEDIRKRPDYYFLRLEVRIDEEDRQEFWRRFQIEVDNFAEWSERDPINDCESTHNCIGAYGPCRFLGLCSKKNLEGYDVKKHHHSELSAPEDKGQK